MSNTSRNWADWEQDIDNDDPTYGHTMKNVGRWARQGRDKSKVTAGDEWERASKRADKKGKRKRVKSELRQQDEGFDF